MLCRLKIWLILYLQLKGVINVKLRLLFEKLQLSIFHLHFVSLEVTFNNFAHFLSDYRRLHGSKLDRRFWKQHITYLPSGDLCVVSFVIQRSCCSEEGLFWRSNCSGGSSKPSYSIVIVFYNHIYSAHNKVYVHGWSTSCVFNEYNNMKYFATVMLFYALPNNPDKIMF